MTQLMNAPTNGTSGEMMTQGEKRLPIPVQDSSLFANLLDTGKFEHLWRVSQMFASSKLIPETFQGKASDCFVACQMAIRLGVDPLMFMQNTYVYKGRPGMEGKLVIALINTSGLFRGPLRFEFSGQGDDYGCVAWSILRETGERVDGPRVTIKIAKAEGWYAQNRKWQTITDLMLQYRAGAWFGRAKCPERLMGMETIDELREMRNTPNDVDPTPVSRTKNVLAKITSKPVSEGQTFEADPDAAEQLGRQDEALADAATQAQTEADVDAAGAEMAEPKADDGDPQIDAYEEAVKECEDRKRLLLSAAKEMGVGRAEYEGWQFKFLQAKGTNLDNADVPTIAAMLCAIKTGKAVWATGTINS